MRRAAGRRGALLARVLQTCASLTLFVLLGAAVWRAVGASPPETQMPSYRQASDLPALLAYGDLPTSFGCSGRTWHAIGAGRVRNEHLLAPVQPGIVGHPVFRQRGASPSGRPRLLVPVALRGPLARIYVWYEPE